MLDPHFVGRHVLGLSPEVKKRERRQHYKKLRVFLPRFEEMEIRQLLATMVWAISTGGNWNAAGNWVNQANSADHHVPTATDDAVIPALGSGNSITHNTGADTVDSVTSSTNLILSGGSLSVTGNLQISSGSLLTVQGGTLGNATVTSGTRLVLTNNGGTLAGVTIAAGATIDGTVATSGGAAVVNVTGGLTLNGALDLGSPTGAVSAWAFFSATQTLAGSGTVVLGNLAGNELLAEGNNGNAPATLTLGSGITIQGGSGTIGGAYSTDSVVNDGTISLASASTVTLTGTFSPAGLGTFNATGATIKLSGTIQNAGTTLTLSPTLGNWNLYGGKISGGTISSTGGSKLALTNSSGTLAGVTIAAGATIDGTVATSGGAAVVNVTGGLTLNGEMDLGSPTGAVSAWAFFAATQTLAGSGTVVLGSSAGNELLAEGNNGNAPATLTLGSGITLEGGNGAIGGYYSTDSIVNDGTISLASASTVTLTGTFSPAGLGTFNATGATIKLSGTIQNAGTTLTLSPTLGNWNLYGGKISGGTISSTGGSKLALTNSSGTLAGVTIAAGATIDGTVATSGGAAVVNVTGGLTLNGEMDLGSPTGAVSAWAFFAATQTLAGSGTVVLGSSAGNELLAEGNNGNAPATLTLGSGITLEGGNGAIGGYYSTDSIVNDGTISLASASTVTLTGTFSPAGLGTFNATGATIKLSGTIQNAGTTLTLSPTLGNWNLYGGKISGGTISSTGGSKLALTNSSGTLAGVTIAAGATIDGTVATSGGAAVVNVTGGLTLNGEMDLGSPTGAVSAWAFFAATQTLAGSGTVVLGSSAGNELLAEGNNGNAPATLTLGSGITLEGGNGAIGGYYSTDSIVNDGTISLASASTVTLTGTFSPAGLGTFNATGATIKLSGTIQNAGTTLTLSPTLGNWNLYGGKISGGTISSTGGSKLALTNSSGTLAGVTIAAGATIDGTVATSGGAAVVNVTGGLTLNGEMDLGSPTGAVSAWAFFAATQTLAGSGTVVLGSSAGNELLAEGNNGNAPATLTIASGITVKGGSGSITAYYSGDSIVFDGTLAAATSGKTVTIGNGGSGNTLTGFTSIGASNGAGIAIPESVQVNGSSILTISPNSSLAVGGNLLGTTQNPVTFNLQGTVTLNGSGSAASPQLLEAIERGSWERALGLHQQLCLWHPDLGKQQLCEAGQSIGQLSRQLRRGRLCQFAGRAFRHDAQSQRSEPVRARRPNLRRDYGRVDYPDS